MDKVEKITSKVNDLYNQFEESLTLISEFQDPKVREMLTIASLERVMNNMKKLVRNYKDETK